MEHCSLRNSWERSEAPSLRSPRLASVCFGAKSVARLRCSAAADFVPNIGSSSRGFCCTAAAVSFRLISLSLLLVRKCVSGSCFSSKLSPGGRDDAAMVCTRIWSTVRRGILGLQSATLLGVVCFTFRFVSSRVNRGSV